MSDKKLMNVSKVLKDVKKLLTETHDVKQVKYFYNYKGEEITHNSILVTDFNIKQSMSKSNLDWGREEHGIEMLDVITGGDKRSCGLRAEDLKFTLIS